MESERIIKLDAIYGEKLFNEIEEFAKSLGVKTTNFDFFSKKERALNWIKNYDDEFGTMGSTLEEILNDK